MEDQFQLYLDRLNVQDVLYYAGYRQNRRDGLRYPSYVRLDSDGRRIKGDKYICMPGSKTCFKPPVVKSYNIISLITNFPDLFPESKDKTGADLVHAVCRNLLNMPEQERSTYIQQPQSQKSFDIKDYSVKSFQRYNKDSYRSFMPYLNDRGISAGTLCAFGKNVLVTQNVTNPDKKAYSNFAFPFRIPGQDKIVGLEERGRSRIDGTSGYKGMASGTNASEGLWIASPAGTKLKDAKSVYWFESGYDAMAYYQLHSKQTKDLDKAVFLSTGGTPSVMQYRGVIREATNACHHLCFDNDLAGRQYCVNFNGELKRLHENGSLKDLGTYNVPEWALCAMENGDYEGLDDEETETLNEFMEKHFPEGYVSSIDWDNPHEFNRFPSFGTRNQHALTSHGESSYLAVKTYPVHFLHPSQREDKTLANITVAREIPQRGAKDFNDELRLLNEELNRLEQQGNIDNDVGEESERKIAMGVDMDSDGDVELNESDEKKLRHGMNR